MEEHQHKVLGGIDSIEKTLTYYEIKFATNEEARLFILNDHVIRYYLSPTKSFREYPEPINKDDVAKVVVKTVDGYGYESFLQSTLEELKTHYIIKTKDIRILFDKERGTTKIRDDRTDKDVLIESIPICYNSCRSRQTLHQRNDEYFFGGGVQNGRYNHKGKVIQIVNTDVWTDGGVSSPSPFYWSSYGYGILRNTWQKGSYDFGMKSNSVIETIHNQDDFDVYYFINSKPKNILTDYYELTGNPALLPEYALYEAHLNAFNRDYWLEVSAETDHAILFEDGKYYKCYSPKDDGKNEGILESLNGENCYQFSARAMIDRYKKHDMPLGWFIPNDGYGCGYGQTDTLDGDVQNLKRFSSYCKESGVQLALWTESNLHPADPLHPKKGERDLVKEVSEAGVVALKCDVAWIGSGYSFGLSAIEKAAGVVMQQTKKKVRPMILTVNGWAGTQRCASVWTGDQKGGEWEYIRFHIPTYIGSGLSGLPFIGSDMDGIFGGCNKIVNIRDYQWKTFTPLQLNMDGWGNTPKTPFSYDEEATTINRAYLKLKSILMPYNYSIAFESTQGAPMLRAMFLEFPDEERSYTEDSQYQYMWGPSLLVAPVYTDVSPKENFLSSGIFLPDENQTWIDFFTGEKYQGGKKYNNFVTPLWKLPVFVKEGCIIPMTNPNNNPNEIERDNRIFTIYPSKGEYKFRVYEDDGMSLDYQHGNCASTEMTVTHFKSNILVLMIKKTTGTYKTMIKERSTLIQMKASKNVNSIKVVVNGEPVGVPEAANYKEFKRSHQSYYFDERFLINPYLSKYNVTQRFLLIKIPKLDVTTNDIVLKVKDFEN